MIRGLQKSSFIDYPGKISAGLFVGGCNFRCGFCHNPELVYNRKNLPKYSDQEILDYLNKRKKILEAVVISGGEPTIYKKLPVFLKKLKNIGFLIKLDTNGTNPSMLKQLINDKLIDYLAMDLKGPLAKYQLITNNNINLKNITTSIDLIINSQLPYEFRSTVLPYFHKEEDIINMAKLITGADLYYLQPFVPRDDLVNKKLIKAKGFSKTDLREIAKKCQQFVKKCLIR